MLHWKFFIEDGEMWPTFLQSFRKRDYKVDWKIIGTDGHPIEGIFSFSVDAPVTEAPAEEQVEPQEETQPQPKVEEKEVNTVNEEKDEEIQHTNTLLCSSHHYWYFNPYCCGKFLIDDEKEEIDDACYRNH